MTPFAGLSRPNRPGTFAPLINAGSLIDVRYQLPDALTAPILCLFVLLIAPEILQPTRHCAQRHMHNYGIRKFGRPALQEYWNNHASIGFA